MPIVQSSLGDPDDELGRKIRAFFKDENEFEQWQHDHTAEPEVNLELIEAFVAGKFSLDDVRIRYVLEQARRYRTWEDSLRSAFRKYDQ